MKVVIEMSKELFEQIKNVDIEECETQTEKSLTNIIKRGVPLFEVGQKVRIKEGTIPYGGMTGEIEIAQFKVTSYAQEREYQVRINLGDPFIRHEWYYEHQLGEE